VLEFERWAPDVVKVTYKGNALARRSIQSELKKSRFNVLLTTYELIMKDKAALCKVCTLVCTFVGTVCAF